MSREIKIPSIPIGSIPMEFELFPSVESVFSTDVDRHRKLFLPLARMPLGLIGVSGFNNLSVPIVIPYEPFDGQIGDGAEEYFTKYCQSGWVPFAISDGKIKFDGDYRFFDTFRMPNSPYVVEGINESSRRVQEYRNECKNTLAYFLSTDESDNDHVIFKYGDKPVENNYNFNDSFGWDSEKRAPVDEFGLPFIYVCSHQNRMKDFGTIDYYISRDAKMMLMSVMFS